MRPNNVCGFFYNSVTYFPQLAVHGGGVKVSKTRGSVFKALLQVFWLEGKQIVFMSYAGYHLDITSGISQVCVFGSFWIM